MLEKKQKTLLGIYDWERRSKLRFAFLLILALGWALPAFAQTPASTPASGPPDVLVLVYQRPDIGDQVGITYPHAVPHAQAQRDLTALAQASGWMISGSHISDAAPPVQGQSKIGTMTSASFVAPNVINNTTHTFPLEAFLQAFRPYKSLRLIFVVSSGFTFQGIRNYADDKVRFTLDQHGSAYTYQIEILNPNFNSRSLSLSGSPASRTSGRSVRLKAMLGIVAAAVVTGFFVYLLMVRTTRKPQEITQEEKHEEPKIGTKG